MEFKKAFFDEIKNEKGGMAVLLSVLAISMIVVTSLTSVYSYLSNRSKTQAFVRMNYQFGFVVEDLARAVVEARKAQINGACVSPNQIGWLDCQQVCMQNTRVAPLVGHVPSDTTDYAVCVKNEYLGRLRRGSDYFCINQDTGTGPLGNTPPSFCGGGGGAYSTGPSLKETQYAVQDQTTKLNRWYQRLDRFYDSTIIKNAPMAMTYEVQPPTILKWIFPHKAFAVEMKTQGSSHYVTTNPTNEEGIVTQVPTTNDGDTNPDANHNGPNAIQYVSVGAINCQATPRPNSCKTCNASDRISSCMELVFIPPWIGPSARAYGSVRNNPNAFHQVIRF